ncbi:AT-rich interactive domain-containing protein 5B-like [Esox lucius]|uniref:AT-rich interactive domain-containing protein 5B-like n=1 Tax=Esox lucius TaxID=8010 RepID=UPI000576643C|nr:AT-rich interactive domain-containing protein 5B-like [Esox lucius]XP_019903227.1 AT-rich interactive domain-containing protein 5B-like [Esox lucius]
MEPNSLKWVGSSCGLHGPYIFYKAYKFHRDGKPRILSLGDFFFVRCKPGDPICIAELQLLWEERTTKQLLSSSKLYFLPEDTPLGRTVSHGEHEVIAVSEKVIVRLEDLVKWTVPEFSGWAHGLQAAQLKPSVLRELGTNGRREALHRYRESTFTSGLNFRDIQRERALLGQEDDGRKVLVLSYPQYCRYRSVLARLREQPSALLMDHTVLALGGIASLHSITRILYCRDTFEHPTLLQNESICDKFAPNLKGRPRKKLSASQRRDSQGHSQGPQGPQEPSIPENQSPTKVKPNCKGAFHTSKGTTTKPRICKKALVEEKVDIEEKEKKEKEKKESLEEDQADEQAFLEALYKYMKERDTPIERIPFLGFKQINLWTMFQAAQKLGGYEMITVRRQWKNVYDELGGNPGSTSAATCTRRHYERLLLPYERHAKGEKDKSSLSAKTPKLEYGAVEVGAKPKGITTRQPKGGLNQKQVVRKDRDNTAEGQELSQVSEKHQEPVTVRDTLPRGEPEEEHLQLTLKKEETLNEDKPFAPNPLNSDCHTATPDLDNNVCPQPERRHPNQPQSEKPDHEPSGQADGSLPKTPDPHHWETNDGKHGYSSKPSTPGTPLANDTDSHGYGHGGRVGKVLPMCKQSPPSVPLDSTESLKDSPSKNREVNQCPLRLATAYSKDSLGVMSPLAKKKLLSQVCETNHYSFSAPPLLPPAPSASAVNVSDSYFEEVVKLRQDSLPESPEMAPVFRPSVIQHAQSIKPHHERSPLGNLSEPFTCRLSHFPPRLNPPWHSYLHRIEPQDGVENAGERPTQHHPSPVSTGYGGDCYSSPHLHNLYRQTENCLSQERMSNYPNTDKQGTFMGECQSTEVFTSNSPDRDGLAYRPPHFSERTPGDRPLDEEPQDFSISKHGSQRMSFTKPSFCDLPYPMMHHSLGGHPKACRVPPMTTSTPKQNLDPPQPSLNPKGHAETVGASRPSKRSLGELENEGLPERKVRVVTPKHPADSVRRGDPQGKELKPAEPAHGIHLHSHEGHTYPPHAPFYPGMYSGMPDSLRHNLQYLKSQAAVSPLVPPLTFHSIMLQRQLMVSQPSPQHFYRYPGGAALYGDILQHLYPLTTLTPAQLSSMHPSTRL